MMLMIVGTAVYIEIDNRYCSIQKKKKITDTRFFANQSVCKKNLCWNPAIYIKLLITGFTAYSSYSKRNQREVSVLN